MIGNKIADFNDSPVAVVDDDCDRRILILAPSGLDARLTSEFLAKASIPATCICDGVEELCDEISRGCGAIILAEEVLSDDAIGNLLSLLHAQPTWSDIPIVLVTRGGEVTRMQLSRLGVFGRGGNVTLLERPFRPGTLVSLLEVALRARRRQYEARDFVERLERARDEAQMASRAKDAFLAALSHELRTPLSPVLLIASEYSCDKQLPEEVRHAFETVLKSVELEARLIDDLLDLTRVTTGKLILRREDVSVHDILMDALDTVRAEIQKKGIHLDLNLAAAHSTVHGDAVRLQQVFWNILTNAVKFTPKNGTVSVETSMVRHSNTSLLVRITDTGIGMTPEESARVFQAFVQGDHAGANGSHRFGGLGLGLAISKNLIHLHSGTITTESAGRNQGSTFTVTLPLVGVS